MMEVGRRVADTFTDQCVLVTGASGFLGKVLVEKLLYSAPGVKNIYLLIRSKRDLSPKQRLQKILEAIHDIQGPLFDRLRAENPEALSKLIPVCGDLMEEGLGLNQLDMNRICDEVGIVFHCAATVKFDEALRTSVEMNVMGTQRLIALCHKMRNLVAIVHASTAYANCDRSETAEMVYPAPVPVNKLFEAIHWMDDDMINSVTPYLLGKRPNTYTFTKALAEVQLLEDAKELPLIIIRPSIIGAMWKEPLPGWTDNFNGPSGIFAACGKGVLTNMCGSNSSKADIIPVDIVSNTLIVAAAHRAHNVNSDVPIIHCCSGTLNPIKWARIVNYLQRFYRAYPLNQCLGVPSTHFHSSRFLFELNFYLKHWGPAYVMDLICRFLGKKPQYVKIYQRVWRLVETLHYFTTRGWSFESKGLLNLWDSISEEDQKVFNFDVRQLNWDEYLFDYMMGVKLYLLKEKMEDISKARRNLTWLKLCSVLFSGGFWWLIASVMTRRRSRRNKWILWAIGFIFSYLWSFVDLRARVHLKTLEEYRKTALCC